MAARTYSTDVYVACPCPECGGCEVRVTLRRYRSLCRLPSPAHERAVHQLVSKSAAALPISGVGGGDTKITDR